MTATTTEIIARAIVRREGQLSSPANAPNVGGSRAQLRGVGVELAGE